MDNGCITVKGEVVEVGVEHLTHLTSRSSSGYHKLDHPWIVYFL